jgi:cytochrome b pre-mRNA-processing protein 3
MIDSERANDRYAWAGALAVVVGFFTLWFLQTRHEQQVIRELPAAQRHALYERTFETLSTVCVKPGDPMLQDYCRSQAAFIVRFPECDDACRALVQPHSPRAVR